MTEIFRLQQAPLEHMLKQPLDLRYALFCDGVLKGDPEVACDSRNRLGHLGDFKDYPQAKEGALIHPHQVLIRFYPDFDNNKPSEEFINDFNNQNNQRSES